MQVTSIACPFSKFVSFFMIVVLCVVKQFVGFQEVPSHLMVIFVSSDVLIAVTVKITVSFNVVLCRLVAGYVSEELATSIFMAQDLYKCTNLTSVPRQQCSVF